MESKLKAVFTVVEDAALGRNVFRRIGTGFVNRDASLSIVLDALPVSGRMFVRDIDTRRQHPPAEDA